MTDTTAHVLRKIEIIIALAATVALLACSATNFCKAPR